MSDGAGMVIKLKPNTIYHSFNITSDLQNLCKSRMIFEKHKKKCSAYSEGSECCDNYLLHAKDSTLNKLLYIKALSFDNDSAISYYHPYCYN